MTSLQDDAAAFLVSLARANISPDVQELLVYGNPDRGVAPRAIEKALAAVRLQKITKAGVELDRILQDLADSARNAALECAAKAAEIEGSPAIAARIRKMKNA